MDVCFILNPLLTLLAQGAVVAMIVNALKRIPWVAAKPWAASAVLNALAAVLAGTVLCGADLGSILAAWVTGFAGSTAAYQNLLKPLAKKLEGGAGGPDPGPGPDPGRSRLR